ncbi:MAG: hypothetical protein KatS3mg090_0481 [Patescibacteria group bacterium]|nr:MAG: hypothetical protein KatS3mg090_0481 [Patescibacteria group bacterium]
MPKYLKKAFLIALLIRLLLLPYFAYPEDIFETHNTSFLILDNLRNIFNIRFSPLSHLIDAVFLFIFSPVWPEGLKSALQTQNYFYIPQIHRVLFFFKLPFLIFEFTAYIIFYKFLAKQNVKKDKIKSIMMFLLFNPAVIYSVYIFSRFESYGFIFSFLILIFLYRKSFSIATILIFALAPFVREFFIIILFGLILFSEFKVWQKIALLILSYLPYPWYVFKTGIAETAIDSYVKGGLGYYILQPRFYYLPERPIYLYFFILFLLLTFLYLKSKSKAKFSQAGFINLSIYYALAYFHPQYFSWVLPFLAFFLVFENKDFNKLLKIAWVICFLFLAFPFSHAVTTFGPAFPVANAFRFISLDKILPEVLLYSQIFQSIFRGVLISFTIYISLR